MAIGEISATTSRVREQYEEYPYPPRDPADESKRVLATRLDELGKLNHYCYRGRRNFRQGFRALVAGGGTGHATVFLAEQLRQFDAQIVHLDLSAASMAIAKERIRVRELQDRVRWINGSLLELASFDLEPFDYINCCGVLHHLEDPRGALAEMKRVSRKYIVLSEPNRNNPLMFGFGLLKKVERGTLKFSLKYMKKLMIWEGLEIISASSMGIVLPNKTPTMLLPYVKKLDGEFPLGFYNIVVGISD